MVTVVTRNRPRDGASDTKTAGPVSELVEGLSAALERRLGAHPPAGLLAHLTDLRTRLGDPLGDLLGLLDDLLDALDLGLLEFPADLLDRLLGALTDRLRQVGLPEEQRLLEVDDLREIRQFPGGVPVAGLHRLAVRPLGVRF